MAKITVKQKEADVQIESVSVIESVENPSIEQTAELKPINEDKILVDKDGFYRMAYALGTSKTQQYTGFSAIRKIGSMLGAKSFEEENVFWMNIKEYISEKK